MINQTEINALAAKREEITYCRFNQDCTCLVVGTKIHGFYIYKLSPLQLIYSSASDSSEPMHCVCVEMCYTSNIMAIVQTPAKIAAKKDRRSIQQIALVLFGLLELGQQAADGLHRFDFDELQLFQLARILAVM